jgi:glycosyltransferase involved in cell wall biosynthesis
MPRLSALIVAHNEEANLAACLATVRFCDEILVVLDRCTDGSAAIARAAADRVIEGAWPLEGPRRNDGIAACSGEWIFELDADERATPELAAEIRAALATAQFGRFIVPVANHIGGRLVRYGWGAYNGVAAKPILFAKGAKIWGNQPVHPKLDLSGAERWLTNPILHYVDRDFADMMDRLNRYSSAHAEDLIASGRIGSLAGNVRRFFTRSWKSYVQRKGYREGVTGLMLALFSGLYPLLSYLKARERLQSEQRESP